MINWNFKKSPSEGQVDLPIPTSAEECDVRILELEEILEFFDFDLNTESYTISFIAIKEMYLDEYYESVLRDAADLLYKMDPRKLTESNYLAQWENSIKMWIFKYEVASTLKSTDAKDHNLWHLFTIAIQYLDQLHVKYEEITGHENPRKLDYEHCQTKMDWEVSI